MRGIMPQVQNFDECIKYDLTHDWHYKLNPFSRGSYPPPLACDIEGQKLTQVKNYYSMMPSMRCITHVIFSKVRAMHKIIYPIFWH